LKLAEINSNRQKKRNFKAYAIVAIARAMRDTAIDAVFIVSASRNIKRQLWKTIKLSANGQTEKALSKRAVSNFSVKALYALFDKSVQCCEQFSIIDDIYLSPKLTEEDKIFLSSQLNGTVNEICSNPKQKWLKMKKIRSKLIESDYGIR